MAIRSMTGFGAGTASAYGVGVEVQLSSVNRKQFDCRINMPRSVVAMESRVGELVHKQIARGMINGSVDVTVSGAARAGAVSVDIDAARGYLAELRKVAKKLGLKDDLTLRALTHLPEIVRIKSIPVEQDSLWKLIEKAAGMAISELLKARGREGKALQKDIESRLESLEKKTRCIRELAPCVAEKHKTALFERLEKAGVKTEPNDASLARELVFFADRSDITEELVRLESHFAQARVLIRSAEPAGRSLDFLCQEMFREINTIGSKANDGAITKHVVEFKTELECVREQVQNVE